MGDTELDPRATIMLTALRGGVASFDCPAPPLIENDKSLSSSGNAEGASTVCWDANRQSEVQVANAFDQAWDALLEEDDGEAMHVLRGEGDASAITLSCRLGYRSAVVLSEDDVKDAIDSTEESNDCIEREGKFDGDAQVGMLHAGKPADETEDSVAQPAVVLVHNLSKDYVLHSLRTSPLVQQYKVNNESGGDDTPKKNVRLISLAHNPETQIAVYLQSNNHQQATDDSTMQLARDFMKQSLTSAFVGYEIAVKEGLIDGYGVDSNGLSLQKSHDLYLGWRDVLECAADAYSEVHDKRLGVSSLKVIRLPGNMLETRGLAVANEMCSFFGNCGGENGSSTEEQQPSEEGLPSFTDDQSDPFVQQKQKLRQLRNLLPKSIDVYVTRPLTAYPYGGTGWMPDSPPGLTDQSGAGSGSSLISTPPLFLKGQESDDSGSVADGKEIDSTHPIRILDYQVEAGSAGGGEGPSLIWSNQHYRLYGPRPSSYQPILNAALAHFDADEILEASRERELTVEERETLDGCKLLRDMIHDLDASLDTMKSYAAYEEYLMKTAVPLMYGSFEELDEESAGYLQLFFRAHGMAVRMVVARWTRELLLAGWKKGTDAADDKEGVSFDKEQEKIISKIWTQLGFGDFRGGYNIPEDVTLQDFALNHLLEDSTVQGVVVGCSRPEHVLEAMRAADSSDDGHGEYKP